MRKKILRTLLAAGVALAALVLGPASRCGAGAKDLPVAGAVYHVQRADGRHKTYLDIIIGPSFEGRLPDDILSITVAGPDGKLPVGRADFNYNPRLQEFWAALPGFPKIGRYTFHVAGRNGHGTARNTQKINRTIPLPDASRFKLSPDESAPCRSPVFSWPAIKAAIPLYYQVEIRDRGRTPLFKTQFIRDMTEVRIPADMVKPGGFFQWRVRVADGEDWSAFDNRSQSRWVTGYRSRDAQPCGYRYRVPPQADGEWEVASLEREDIDAAKIAAMMQRLINDDIPHIHSVLMVKNGRLVLEEYLNGYARNAKHDLMSASKSVTSILVGMARDQGKIESVDCRLLAFFPSYRDIDWGGLKKEIRLKHVLTMSAGLAWNAWQCAGGDRLETTTEMIRSPDWIKFVLARKAVDPPGTRFLYNNGLTLLLGAIIKNTTALSADDFAAEQLFRPLGITDFSWQKNADGTVNTAWGLRLRPRDMAKIGYLMLKDGTYKGQPIVSSAWVRESTTSRFTKDILLGGGYGYQWWRGETLINEKRVDLFYAAGKGGQNIFVVPTLELVVVITSKTSNDGFGEYRPQALMTTYILPAVLGSAPARRTAEIDRQAWAQYVGAYEFKCFALPLTIFQEGDHLYLKDPDEAQVALAPEGAMRFAGTSEKVGDFVIHFFKNRQGRITHFIGQVGFSFWRFDKIK
jgi:CubicO group peptidase (beta-lactamase class C family)